MRIRTILSEGAAGLRALDAAALDRFEKYYEFLEERGAVVNLTAITGEESVARMHFLDSLFLFGAADLTGARVLDVGSGAGFPGLPLKIAEPLISLTLVDSLGKRVTFLKELCARLDIEAECINARAEELALLPDYRGGFDFAVSRAVAELNMLCELCLPFLKVGGSFLAMKGRQCETEIEEAQNAIGALGGSLAGRYDYALPGLDILHSIVVVKKTGETPDSYPRRFAKIKKSPL